MRWRAPGRLPWKSLVTFPPHVPSPTSSTELYSVRIKSQKVKTNRITGQPTGTGRAPLIDELLLSKQTGPPLSALGHNYLIRVGVYHQVSVVRHDNDLAPLLRVAEICVCGD
jgi:hypothetical protein